MTGEIRGKPVNINGRSGSSPGPATGTAARIAIPMPSGYSATVDASGISPQTTFARALYITNLDAANDLRVYFPHSGNNYVTITAGNAYAFQGMLPFFAVQSSAASTLWEALAIVAA